MMFYCQRCQKCLSKKQWSTSIRRPEGSDNAERYALLSKWHCKTHTLVGLHQITDKNVLSESDQFTIGSKLQHHDMRQVYCDEMCLQLGRWCKVCLQHYARYPATLQGSLKTRGKNSEANKFMLVTGKQRAPLAEMLALSLPAIFTWLGIQHIQLFYHHLQGEYSLW